VGTVHIGVRHDDNLCGSGLWISKSSPMPVPRAVIMVRISSLAKILSIRAFSTLMIFPAGAGWPEKSAPFPAWQNLRPNPLPPGTAPKGRVLAGTVRQFARQGADLQGVLAAGQFPGLPGCFPGPEGTDGLVHNFSARGGFFSRKTASLRRGCPSTTPRISLFPSLVLVWPSNWGSFSLMLMMAVNPSRISSPERLASLSFNDPFLAGIIVDTRVRAFLKPSSWVPPHGWECCWQRNR
jgi:hypothetical protein